MSYSVGWWRWEMHRRQSWISTSTILCSNSAKDKHYWRRAATYKLPPNTISRVSEHYFFLFLISWEPHMIQIMWKYRIVYHSCALDLGIWEDVVNYGAEPIRVFINKTYFISIWGFGCFKPKEYYWWVCFFLGTMYYFSVQKAAAGSVLLFIKTCEGVLSTYFQHFTSSKMCHKLLALSHQGDCQIIRHCCPPFGCCPRFLWRTFAGKEESTESFSIVTNLLFDFHDKV